MAFSRFFQRAKDCAALLAGSCKRCFGCSDAVDGSAFSHREVVDAGRTVGPSGKDDAVTTPPTRLAHTVKTPNTQEQVSLLTTRKENLTSGEGKRAENEGVDDWSKAKKERRNEQIRKQRLNGKRPIGDLQDLKEGYLMRLCSTRWLFRPRHSKCLTFPVTNQDGGGEYRALFDTSQMRHEADRLASFQGTEGELERQNLWPGPLAADGYFFDHDSRRPLCYYCSRSPHTHGPLCNWQRCNVAFGSAPTTPIGRVDQLQMMGVAPRADNHPREVAPGQGDGSNYGDRAARLESLVLHCPEQNCGALADAGFYSGKSCSSTIYFVL